MKIASSPVTGDLEYEGKGQGTDVRALDLQGSFVRGQM